MAEVREPTAVRLIRRTERAVASRVNVDRALAAVCLMGAAFSAWLLVFDRGDFNPKDRQGAVVASLEFVEGGVRHRPADTLVWDSAATGLQLIARDAVFVAPKSQARLEFKNGAVMEISENALVVIEEQADGVVAELKQGAIAAVGGAGKMQIKNAAGTVKLEKGDVANVEETAGELKVDVVQGAPALDGKAQQRAYNVALLQPAPFARFFARRGAPPKVAFELGGDVKAVAAIEVSTEKGFGSLAAKLPPRAAYAASGFGTYYWRAVDVSGKALSPALQFSVFEDTAPQLLSPKDGDTVIGASGPAALLWAQQPRASAYDIELSFDPTFEKTVMRAQAKTVSLVLPRGLNDGTLYWRVRANDALRTESPWSQPASFRFSAKALPKPPRLKDSKLEVEHAPPPP